jgi:hypothetical protein
MPWLLNQIHQHDTNTGPAARLFHPALLSAGRRGRERCFTATQLLRNESTRQFWDTNYVDQSWIGQQPPTTS